MPVLHLLYSYADLYERQGQIDDRSYEHHHARERVVTVVIEIKARVLEPNIPDNRRKNDRPEYLNDEVNRLFHSKSDYIIDPDVSQEHSWSARHR